MLINEKETNEYILKQSNYNSFFRIICFKIDYDKYEIIDTFEKVINAVDVLKLFLIGINAKNCYDMVYLNGNIVSITEKFNTFFNSSQTKDINEKMNEMYIKQISPLVEQDNDRLCLFSDKDGTKLYSNILGVDDFVLEIKPNGEKYYVSEKTPYDTSNKIIMSKSEIKEKYNLTI